MRFMLKQMVMLHIYCPRIVSFIRYFKPYIAILFFIALISAGYIIALFTTTQKQLLYVTVDCPFPTAPTLSGTVPSPVVKFYGVKPNDFSLDIVKDVFDKLGYQPEYGSSVAWEIMWSHIYPFHEVTEDTRNLRLHQKINHFPGSGYITQKSYLVQLPVSHMPKSFILPDDKEEFLKYAKVNDHLKWVLKSSNHRSIQIIDSHSYPDANDSFIQEFIKNPLLINERKFDIGIYVVLTSIDPLRVYIYSEDILLRFCEEVYDPENMTSFDSYVVGDNYLPIWNVPDLKHFYSVLNYTAKETFNAYIQSKGKDPKKVWSQINESIQQVYFATEDDFKKSTLAWGSLRNYFEMVRFDFILDEDLKVYLLEVNMSPNLSAAHYIENTLLYEQVVFNTLCVVGACMKFPKLPFYKGELEVSQKDIQVYPEQCASSICQKSCKSLKCIACNQCMNNELKQIARSAYLEHGNRGKYRRIIPVPVGISRYDHLQSHKPLKLSEMNAFMDVWFKGKCLQDITWCQ